MGCFGRIGEGCVGRGCWGSRGREEGRAEGLLRVVEDMSRAGNLISPLTSSLCIGLGYLYVVLTAYPEEYLVVHFPPVCSQRPVHARVTNVPQ
jgi:hypothetical protein